MGANYTKEQYDKAILKARQDAASSQSNLVNSLQSQVVDLQLNAALREYGIKPEAKPFIQWQYQQAATAAAQNGGSIDVGTFLNEQMQNQAMSGLLDGFRVQPAQPMQFSAPQQPANAGAFLPAQAQSAGSHGYIPNPNVQQMETSQGKSGQGFQPQAPTFAPQQANSFYQNGTGTLPQALPQGQNQLAPGAYPAPAPWQGGMPQNPYYPYQNPYYQNMPLQPMQGYPYGQQFQPQQMQQQNMQYPNQQLTPSQQASAKVANLLGHTQQGSQQQTGQNINAQSMPAMANQNANSQQNTATPNSIAAANLQQPHLPPPPQAIGSTRDMTPEVLANLPKTEFEALYPSVMESIMQQTTIN